MEELFWKYIDGQSTTEENKEVEQLLNSNEQARVLMAQLKKMDSSLVDLTHHTSKDFTTKLLSRILPPKVIEHASFKPVFYILLALLITSLLVSLIPSTSQNKPSLIENLLQQIDLAFSQKYLIFGLAALSAILVIWFDLIYQRSQSNLKK